MIMTKKMRSPTTSSTLHIAVIRAALALIGLVGACDGQLQNNFYQGKCGNASVESIIQGVVQSRFTWERRIVAGLLRLQFHDCFVNGCDGSILIDGPNSEKTALPNYTVFGYDLIDDIKTAVENACPGVVSCADIIIAATRDAVVLAGGQSYQVQLGRRDGTVSLASLVNLPAPDITVPQAIQMFQQKGLNSFDMTILMGGHTVGVTHCSVMQDRLYNYKGSGAADPSMSPLFVWILSTYVCPKNPTFDNVVFFKGPSGALTIDNGYYAQLLNDRGVLPIDQALYQDSSTAWMVQFLGTTNFFPSLFGYALVKLGAVDVLTGTQGEIRANCRKTN